MWVLGAYPFGDPPREDVLLDAVDRSALALVRGDMSGDRPCAPAPLVARGAELARWRAALAVRPPAEPFHCEGHEERVDLWTPEGPARSLLINSDGAIRLFSWASHAPLADPGPLFTRLSEYGLSGPLRALERRLSPEAPPAAAAFRAAAPPWARPLLDSLPGEPPWTLDLRAVRALVEGAGAGATPGHGSGALFEACAWYGARGGAWHPPFPFEAPAQACLRVIGVHACIEAAASGVPEGARMGMARFLVEEAPSRGFRVAERLPAAVRGALAAAAERASPEDAERARLLFLDEGPLAPPGTELIAAAASGRLRRVTTDGERAFAIDGYDLLRIERGRAESIAKVLRPDSPLLARGGHVSFLHPSGQRRVSVAGGAVDVRRPPLFGLAESRVARARRRFLQRAAAVLASLPAGPVLLDLAEEAAEASAAFGGDLPPALEAKGVWVASPAEGWVRWCPDRGAAVTLRLDGQPVWLATLDGGALVAAARGAEALTVHRARPDGGAAELVTLPVAPDAFRGALFVREELWILLRAPLGDVLVAPSGA